MHFGIRAFEYLLSVSLVMRSYPYRAWGVHHTHYIEGHLVLDNDKLCEDNSYRGASLEFHLNPCFVTNFILLNKISKCLFIC
jgi:hypothetical protein